MEMELLVRILGGLLLIIGGFLLYYSLTDEEKLWKGNKRDNDFGANIKLITGSLILIAIGLVLIISGKI